MVGTDSLAVAFTVERLYSSGCFLASIRCTNESDAGVDGYLDNYPAYCDGSGPAENGNEHSDEGATTHRYTSANSRSNRLRPGSLHLHGRFSFLATNRATWHRFDRDCLPFWQHGEWDARPAPRRGILKSIGHTGFGGSRWHCGSSWR